MATRIKLLFSAGIISVIFELSFWLFLNGCKQVQMLGTAIELDFILWNGGLAFSGTPIFGTFRWFLLLLNVSLSSLDTLVAS